MSAVFVFVSPNSGNKLDLKYRTLVPPSPREYCEVRVENSFPQQPLGGQGGTGADYPIIILLLSISRKRENNLRTIKNGKVRLCKQEKKQRPN